MYCLVILPLLLYLLYIYFSRQQCTVWWSSPCFSIYYTYTLSDNNVLFGDHPASLSTIHILYQTTMYCLVITQLLYLLYIYFSRQQCTVWWSSPCFSIYYTYTLADNNVLFGDHPASLSTIHILYQTTMYCLVILPLLLYLLYIYFSRQQCTVWWSPCFSIYYTYTLADNNVLFGDPPPTSLTTIHIL